MELASNLLNSEVCREEPCPGAFSSPLCCVAHGEVCRGTGQRLKPATTQDFWNSEAPPNFAWTAASHAAVCLFVSILPFSFVQLLQLCVTSLLSLFLPNFTPSFFLSLPKPSGQSPTPIPRSAVLCALCFPRACEFPTTRSLFNKLLLWSQPAGLCVWHLAQASFSTCS